MATSPLVKIIVSTTVGRQNPRRWWGDDGAAAVRRCRLAASLQRPYVTETGDNRWRQSVRVRVRRRESIGASWFSPSRACNALPVATLGHDPPGASSSQGQGLDKMTLIW